LLSIPHITSAAATIRMTTVSTRGRTKRTFARARLAGVALTSGTPTWTAGAPASRSIIDAIDQG
jgi:hypothetical protein